MIEPHGTINDIRRHVGGWRDAHWPGVHSRIQHLLEFWARDDGGGMRPFWCQREAVETLIWLFDAGASHEPEAHAEIIRKLAQTNRDWNESIPRAALKMATGTGKTLLMAMVALWWTVRHPGETVNFLVLTPGLTIRDHLQVLTERRNSVWKAVAPRGFGSDLGRMRWTVLNFQSFQRQSRLAVGGKQATGREKHLLVGKGAPEPDSWRESEAEMLDRLLRAHDANAPLTVINDEAHHCYTYRKEEVRRGREDTEEREDRKRAEVWFGVLRALRRADRLKQVFDLSATPMWLRRPARLKAETFPWTVSDFPLLDAIESGLVKVPRVPVSEERLENGQPIHQQPRYRNIYLHNDRRNIGETLTPEVREPLLQLYDHYRETDNAYAQVGRIPVMIVVANSIKNATMLHRFIAGFSDEEGHWRPGNLPLFSVGDRRTGRAKTSPPTVLVHSKLDDEGGGSTGKIAMAVAEQADLFAPGDEATAGMTRERKREVVRDVFMTVGKKGEPGEHIRCVISVGMLTEGWDARTVTHVFGYRAFGSQLLCEQVAGRALRRTAFTDQDERQPLEYANLFGVPFAFMSGKAVGPIIVPRDETVETLPGREKYRIRFPHVAGYAMSPTPRWTVNLSSLRGHSVRPHPSSSTVTEGVVGADLAMIPAAQTRQSALWQAAAQLVPMLDGGERHRRRAFACSVDILRKCLEVMSCTDWVDLQHDTDTLLLIAEHITRIDGSGSVAPVFVSQTNPGSPKTTDTSSVFFRTVLRNWYPHRRSDLPRTSELSAAACHSAEEAELAGILDTHPDIEAWVRNFRLGWSVPWHDPDRPGTALMEPDFVARAKTRTASGRKRCLVIEFKGLMAGRPREDLKRRCLEDQWAPAVSRRTRNPDDDLGDWQAVWIEDIERAHALITQACQREERP